MKHTGAMLKIAMNGQLLVIFEFVLLQQLRRANKTCFFAFFTLYYPNILILPKPGYDPAL